jgi:hypothetical protein
MSFLPNVRSNDLTDRDEAAFVDLISNADNFTPRLDSYISTEANIGIYMLPYTPAIVTDATKYRIYVFNTANELTAIVTYCIAFNFADVVNGGSGRGSFQVAKRFVDVNWFNYDYRVDVYLEDSVDPWYTGCISEFDPESQDPDQEDITIYCDGYQTVMNRAIVSEILSPGVQPNGVDNGDYYADAYLLHLITTYMDSSIFDAAYVCSMPVYLDQLNFTGEGLADCINDIVTQVSDNTGHIFEWWIRGQAGGKPKLVIQPQADPNTLDGALTYVTPRLQIPAQFQTEIKDETIYTYTVQNSVADVYNQIALYGGNDPITQQQMYSPYQDSTSISLYGVRQQRVTNDVLLSQASLDNYGTVYLLDNAYPQPKAQFYKFVPTDFARAGAYFSVINKGVDGTGEQYVQADGTSIAPTLPQVYDQYRAVEVDLVLEGTGDRIEQEVQLQAPRPYADGAAYNAIVQSKNQQSALANRQANAQVKSYFVREGGEWVS